jgi:hypothetical protein
MFPLGNFKKKSKKKSKKKLKKTQKKWDFFDNFSKNIFS